MSNEANGKTTGQGNAVITPGGPRSPELVNKVTPGDAVVMDAEGQNAMVSSPAIVRDIQNAGAAFDIQGGGGALGNGANLTASALGRAIRPSDIPAISGYVLTPGGYRHQSLVQQVQPNEALHFAEDRVVMQNLTANTTREIMLPPAPTNVVPALGSGWITDAFWNNGTGHTLTTFRTTWQVPPAPTTQQSQIIFLFNGIQNVGTNFGILQPVLQWGNSAAGGGPYWAIASWYVTSGGQAFHTPLVRVNTGDTLVGVMRLTGQANGKFSYTSEFQGVAGTSLPVQNIAELVWCNETLEAYNINDCSNYPNTHMTAMQAIRIETGTTVPALGWTVQNRVTDCGQHTVVVSNSNGEGIVDLFYNNGIGFITEKAILGETAIGSPALANAGNVVALAWTGTDNPHHLNVMTSGDGHNFGGKVTLGDTSIDGPALTAGGGRTYLAWTGTDNPHHVNVMSSTDNHNFGGKVTLGETSPFAPALAFGNGRIYLAWTGTDSQHKLNVMSSTDGVHWGNKVTLGETSFSSPALSWIDGRLYLLWSGTDANRSLNVMDSADGVTFTDKVTLGDSSFFHPALIKNGALLLAWTGKDSLEHLNVLSSASNTHAFGNKVLDSDTAVAAPALATFQNRTLISWTGTDGPHHVNVARLT